MFYEPPKNDHGLPLNPFSACIVPRPIGWVSTMDKDGRPNLAPFSFFNGVGYTPPTVMFCPNGRDLDGGLSHSLLNVQETKEFVVNIATFELALFHEPDEPSAQARRERVQARRAHGGTVAPRAAARESQNRRSGWNAATSRPCTCHRPSRAFR